MISWKLISLALLAKGVQSVAVWGQCGGIGYSGSTACDSGTSCVKLNDYYSQCQPGAATAAPPPTTAAPTSSAPASTPTAGSGGGNPASVPKGQLTEIKNFGSNPTNDQFFIYVPQKLATNPAVIAVPHYCTGTAQAVFTGTQYKNLADQMGFIVIYPDAPDSGGCWDVHTTATLTHNSGGDSLGIASMIRWTIATFNANPDKVFMTGTSSGAMMTNVFAGAYPDLIRAGSAFAGVAYSCFAGPDMWNSACANGQTTKTAQAWGDAVRSGYAGYTGVRPRMQFWHGTADTTLNFNNYGEEIKQWTNVLGVSGTAVATTQNYPNSGWTRSDFGSTGSPSTIKVMGTVATGVTHNIPTQENLVLQFFGLA